jgi:hypothetical protein
MKKFLHTFWGTCACFLLSILIPFNSKAQLGNGSNTEVGLTIGPSNFLGDLGGTYGRGMGFLKDNNFPMTKLMVGAHATFNPMDWLAIRLAVNMGSLEGDDAIIKGKGGLEEARKARNLDFRSPLMEAFVALEVYPTVFLEDDPTDYFHKLRPYGLLGVGVFHFNPQGYDPVSHQWVDLQPLRTEGEGIIPGRKMYSLTQLNIPMGVGVKYWLSDNVSLSLEVIERKTFTDYIDDVSTTYVSPTVLMNYFTTVENNPARGALAVRMADKSANSGTRTAGDKRGTASNNDAYYSFGFKLGIRLGGGNSWGNSTRCPVMRF